MGAVEQAKAELKKTCTALDDYLLTWGTWLERGSLWLILSLPATSSISTSTFVMKPTGCHTPLNRWFNTLIHQAEFKAVIGDFKICEEECQVDPKKFSEFQGKVGGQVKDKKEKKEKKKEEKKPAPKVEPVELDPAEEALSLEPKSKDPFDALPKGSFDFDDFKRFYSNNEESASIPYFWEKFDKENYSIWYGEYKYNEELTQVFMSCNLIGGMFQCLDKMRKQAFGSVCVFGENNNSSISGLFIWRGPGLAFELTPDWQVDYEVYSWEKLDPESEDTKKKVEQYFSWTGADKDGRAFNQGKIFK